MSDGIGSPGDVDRAERDRTWTVPALAGAIGAALEHTFPTEVWVRGEIQNLSRAASGFVYFTLVDTDDDGTPAQMPVVLNSQARMRVNRLLTRSGGSVRMTDGTEVRIRGRLDWYAPRGQLQLRMTSIDPAFTLGQLAVARAELITRLRGEGLLEANRAVPMPMLPLRIALVTAAGSAAEADVLHELGVSGFAFEVTAVDVRVQGPDSPMSVAMAVAEMSRADVEVILIVRGGGAANDLAAFDSELVARAIAAAARPVVTGIGHETDRSVADEVAHTAAKTPTAAAGVLTTAVAAALTRAESAWRSLAAAAAHRLDRDTHRLDALAERSAVAATLATARASARLGLDRDRLLRAAEATLTWETRRIDQAAVRLPRAATSALTTRSERLELLASRVDAVDPVRTLARGYTIARSSDGRLVRSVDDVAAGDDIRLALVDGTAVATVAEILPRQDKS